MPEGHTIHRLAKSLNILFGDRQLQASSPRIQLTLEQCVG